MSRDFMLSFSLDDEIGRVFSRRYKRLVDRCISSPNSGGRYPSRSLYTEYLLERAMRRIENDLYMGGQFKRILNTMIEPSPSDVAKVLLCCHLNPNWSGWIGMNAFERFRKAQKPLLNSSVIHRRSIKSRAKINT